MSVERQVAECSGCGWPKAIVEDGLCADCLAEEARELSGDPHDRFDPDDPDCYQEPWDEDDGRYWDYHCDCCGGYTRGDQWAGQCPGCGRCVCVYCWEGEAECCADCTRVPEVEVIPA
ncbi:MAG: hypothetical protein ACYCT1_08290 [Steroidobacteraceae bacterium]